jgi:RNA polymerase sigma-70 factor (ECF subfamily)
MKGAAVPGTPESVQQAKSLQDTGASTSEGEGHRLVAGLFDTHYDFVWRLVRRLGVPARLVDDAAQQVFIVAARKVSDIEVGRERSFLHGVAIRVASDARDAERRRGGPTAELSEHAESLDPTPDELLDRKRARQRLDEILGAMGIEERTVFVLFEIEGLTMAAIASLEGVPPGTVASRLRRAREIFAHKIARLWPRRPL